MSTSSSLVGRSRCRSATRRLGLGLRRAATWRALVAAPLAGVAALGPALASAAEPAACLSPNPTAWPAPSKPYFLLIVDTSGSMTTTVTDGGGNALRDSCNYGTNRISHARCAVTNVVKAFSGDVNFGLSSYTWKLKNCSGATCFGGCGDQYAPGDNGECGPLVNEPTLNKNVHLGALIDVPLLQDHYWQGPPDASNVASILGFVDNNCQGSNELWAGSYTPLGGALFAVNKYLAGSYVDPFTTAAVPTPLGTAAAGERSCRAVGVILLTDGDETCDSYELVYSNERSSMSPIVLFFF